VYYNKDLQNHLETSSVIKAHSLITAEWNMNVAENIKQVGNYRYRPAPTDTSIYKSSMASFDPIDSGNFYTDATYSDIIIDGGLQDDNTPTAFQSKKEKEGLLFSLESCFGKFRPRSGINKLRYFSDRYTYHVNEYMSQRPRYYMADKDDPFKYWTSYRTENGEERGIANKTINGQHFIDDASPYVVYNNQVPANRIVVKMQTNVGSVDMGYFTNIGGSFADPFYGNENRTVPEKWKIQYLDNNNWVDAVSFTSSSVRSDGTPIIGPDGYVEISYGLIIPEDYKAVFTYAGEYPSALFLPEIASQVDGTAYLVKTSDSDAGIFYMAFEGKYQSFSAIYGWHLSDEEVTGDTNFVSNLSEPDSYVSTFDGKTRYREFSYLSGLRVVVDTMNKFDSTLDLIELSPRLAVDITDKVAGFSITRNASDLGISGMPVGQLLASVGSMDIFDYDQAFFEKNTNSLVSGYMSQNIQIKFYETISDVSGSSYIVPIKTMYSEGFPEISSKDRRVAVQLRDMFLHFESITAPQILVQDVSVSFAISTLLDYAGFSNYVFKRNPGESEMIIPNFSVAPDKTLAEVMSDLAVSSQSAMFFDEYNNFVVMSKNYMMPTAEEQLALERPTTTLSGSKDYSDTGVLKNAQDTDKVANILELASQDNHIYNDGVINYRSAYIQRSYSSIRQANMIDSAKTWVYKPALLWEVSPTDAVRSSNDELKTQAAYTLSAIPLDRDLSSDVPTVLNNAIVNNTMSFGEGVYWLGKYNGYLYANGEVIRFDAVQYSIPGLTTTGADGDNVWVSSVQEYQNYFSKVPFNGKIYPTGLVRIYAEPNYEVINGETRLKTGPVAKHGRAQFGTQITEHKAGVASNWTSSDNLRGVNMNHKYLFSSKLDFTLSSVFTEVSDRGAIDIDNAYETSVPVKITSDTSNVAIITANNHGLIDDQTVYLKTSGTMPNGLVPGIIYGVRYLSDNEFNLYDLTSNQDITVTGNQSGTHSFVPVLDYYSANVSISIANPAVITEASHGMTYGDTMYFTTTDTLPTGIIPNKIYQVSEVDTDTFSISDVIDSGTSIVTSGTQSGTHTMHRVVYPSVFSLNGGTHRLLGGDRVYISGDTAYEDLVNINLKNYDGPALEEDLYTVSNIGLTPTSCLLIKNGDLIPVHTGTTQQIRENDSSILLPHLFENITDDEANAKIVLPDVTNMKVGLKVSIYSGTGVLQDETRIVSVDIPHKRITLSSVAIQPLIKDYIDLTTSLPVVNTIRFIDKLETMSGKAGADNDRAESTSRNSIIKNFLANKSLDEAKLNSMLTTQSGTVQSSALVMNGSSINATDQSPGFISYVYKPLADRFTHFGTRLRIIGKVNNNESRIQSPIGVNTYYNSTTKYTNKSVSIGGSSGGIAVLLNPETNNGYYLEVVAMTESNVSDYEDKNIHNVIFYKVERNANATSDFGNTSDDSDLAVPTKLWGGLANIIVDSGTLVGQYRMASESQPTVYDLAVEYQHVGDKLRFFLYLNNNLIATVDDENPLPVYNNMALFIRGASRLMFENVYALTNNYSQNTTFSLDTVTNSVFDSSEINAVSSFQKYAMSGIIQSTYLSGIGTSEPPKYKIYYDEFGTIMREVGYFDVRYDKAYPALYAKLAPTFNRLKGYTVSGFVAGAYKANFLVFNATDSALNLDSTSGNYLRILGVTFTQQSQNELSVDSYFSKHGNMSDPEFSGSSLVKSPLKVSKDYTDIKLSRLTHGRKQFSINTPYIQSQDEADNIMGWMISKVMKPRKSVGVRVFGLPTMQLGDIVKLNYSADGVDQVSSPDSRFVVYSIEYSKKENGPEMTAYLSEVL
jgi:hypothetical protein